LTALTAGSQPRHRDELQAYVAAQDERKAALATGIARLKGESEPDAASGEGSIRLNAAALARLEE